MQFSKIFCIACAASALSVVSQCSDYWQRLKSYWSQPSHYETPSYISPYKIYSSRAKLAEAQKEQACKEKLLQDPEMVKCLESEPGETIIGRRFGVPAKTLSEDSYYDPVSKTYVYSPEYAEGEPIVSNALYDLRQTNIELQKRIQKLEQNQRNILDLLLTPQSPID